MSTAVKYVPSYTVRDYERWDGDWELWKGMAIAMTPSPFGRHQLVLTNLVYELTHQIKLNDCDCRVFAEFDWIVSIDTVVRPDVIVTCDGVPERHLTSVPAMIAEIVSASTEQKDRNAKFELYQEQGVKYYLIASPKTESVELHALGADGRFASQDCRPRATLRLSDDCQLTIDSTQLFR